MSVLLTVNIVSHNTTQHGAVLIIFPLYQTITITRMLPSGGDGGSRSASDSHKNLMNSTAPVPLKDFN